MLRPPGFYAPLEEALKQVEADKQNAIEEPASSVTRQPEPERNVEAQREFQPIDKTEPGFFDPLNEALAQVKADITQGIDPFDAYQEAMMQLDPTRPEGHPTDHLFHWPPESQSMEHQQRAALERDHVVNGDRTADLANEYAAGLAGERLEAAPEPAREESRPEPARADDRHEPDHDPEPEPEFDFGISRDMGGGGIGG
jgi:hypothetical protein